MSNMIGKVIKQLRIKKGMKQKELAELSQLSSSSVCDIEKGRVNPSLRSLIQIAESLEVLPEEIIKIWRKDSKETTFKLNHYSYQPDDNHQHMKIIEEMVEILRDNLSSMIEKKQNLQDPEVLRLSKLLDSLLNFLNAAKPTE